MYLSYMYICIILMCDKSIEKLLNVNTKIKCSMLCMYVDIIKVYTDYILKTCIRYSV